ncbi:MAG TPA: helix-turn-helix domain-containing protein [Thermoleophilaceae bacterium]|nr:helix-turn-helix domain-containing protein [Thermoleophilaceae bacterium]
MTQRPKRSYRGEARTRQAAETRRRIVEAAARLFVHDGYSATSIAAIATDAGVAEPTVYATLRSKANILRAVIDRTVRGDDESPPLAAREPWKELEREPDARERLLLFVRLHRTICEREAVVFAQLEAAAGADPEATEMLADHDRRRYETQSRLARALRRDGLLREGLSSREAADTIWTLASERTYLALVRDRGWTPARYERWLVEQLAAALLEPARPG